MFVASLRAELVAYNGPVDFNSQNWESDEDFPLQFSFIIQRSMPINSL